MKDIKCPYPWICGKVFNVTTLSKCDCNFVNSAIDKGMTFMFIHCPKCNMQFQFNPITWKATAMYDNPNEKKIAKETKTKKELLEVLKNEKIELPNTYIDFITKKNPILEVSIIKERDKEAVPKGRLHFFILSGYFFIKTPFCLNF